MSRGRFALMLGAVAVVLAIVGFAALRRGTPAPASAPANAAADVPLARVALGSFTARVRAAGRVGTPSGGEAKLAFAQSGIVARIDVQAGQAVAAGQTLAEVDSGGLALDVAQARGDAAAAAASYGGGNVPLHALASARARLSAARERLAAFGEGISGAQSDRAAASSALRQSEAKLSTDRAALDRATTLYAGGVAAYKDVEAARFALDSDRADADAARARAVSAGSNVAASRTAARADVVQAESDVRAAQAQTQVAAAQASSAAARLQAARRSLALATLRATASGVVTAILKHPGEAVDPSQPAIVIAPPSGGEVTLTISGDDARRVAAGDAVAYVSADGGSARGRVRSIVPGVDPTTQTSTVVVDGAPPDAAPGTAVTATIDVGERRGIVIPTRAVVEDPQTGKSIVFVRERAADGSERFASREIRVAAGDDERTLVARGLHAGERIAADGAFDLLAPSGGG